LLADYQGKVNIKTFYERSLREVIKLGGDTDTNACIVGGMIGAYVGVKNINSQMLEKIFKFDCTLQKGRTNRP